MDASADLDSADPRRIYTTRLEGERARETSARQQARRLSASRLGVFLVALVLAILAGTGALGWGWLLLPGIVFTALVVQHGRARNVAFDAARRASIQEDGLARIEDRWAGRGSTGEAVREVEHVYAADLDLFGEGSLFQLLSTARTRAGEAMLARWLLEPACADTVRRRQGAVADLRPRVELRETLAVVGGEISSALDRAVVLTWGAVPPRLAGVWLPRVLAPLGIATAGLGLGWLFGPWPLAPFLVAAVVQGALVLPLARRVQEVLAAADRPAQDLDLVARLLAHLERTRFESRHLVDLQRRLETRGRPPSKTIARLTRLLDFVDARRNQIFLPVSWLLALGTQLAFAIERWRQVHGRDLAVWIEALGEFEALDSLAGYAFEHPADPFPEIVEGACLFDGRGLGHPLLPASTMVRNDCTLQAPPVRGRPQALLVSGSNMSGKSTLLRTLGVNAVLALAGAPVRAEALRISPLVVGTSIRILDSLRGGASHFYAEITRLRQIVDRTQGPVPVLFLLDEMLHGTNSHDRRIGAEAVIRSLLDAGAIGLITTHDLALATIAEADPRMANVHFEDHLEDGRITFDFRMRPGVVTRSNAIALMRAVGLDVGEGEDTAGGGPEGIVPGGIVPGEP
ncbi:MAG: DNA mismatch repair protein MutS [Planctomycetota bacterium]